VRGGASRSGREARPATRRTPRDSPKYTCRLARVGVFVNPECCEAVDNDSMNESLTPFLYALDLRLGARVHGLTARCSFTCMITRIRRAIVAFGLPINTRLEQARTVYVTQPAHGDARP
jgi:hypothetical protein